MGYDVFEVAHAVRKTLIGALYCIVAFSLFIVYIVAQPDLSLTVQKANAQTVVHVGDANNDGKVTISDYEILLKDFGRESSGNIADNDGDNDVDIFDLNILVSHLKT